MKFLLSVFILNFITLLLSSVKISGLLDINLFYVILPLILEFFVLAVFVYYLLKDHELWKKN